MQYIYVLLKWLKRDVKEDDKMVHINNNFSKVIVEYRDNITDKDMHIYYQLSNYWNKMTLTHIK